MFTSMRPFLSQQIQATLFTRACWYNFSDDAKFSRASLCAALTIGHFFVPPGWFSSITRLRGFCSAIFVHPTLFSKVLAIKINTAKRAAGTICGTTSGLKQLW
ncbi:GQ67_03277T0 [Komagataella phaffii]|nr:GQ67_03277T0 [Komagataella phaffii]AOA68544.1 GQ68_03246T0 [Komagataella phaffii GS115]